ncbi:MAG: DUF3108 domain-containing protein [Thermoflexaceae bacterium]|nr:DUF3108 domain-containing protein [Thermoflexaceae bacterium]
MTVAGRLLALCAPLGLLAALAAACAQDIDAPPERVFGAAPWNADEKMTYDLVERGGQVYGRCEVATDIAHEPGTTKLSFLCGDDQGNRDDRIAHVDSSTLEPHSASRTIVKADGKSTVFQSDYAPPVVRLTATEGEKKRTTERDLPVATKENPEPGWYDDESLLWLVRGVPLQNGFQGAFRDVNASTGQVFTVEVTVEEQETLQVPAGEFTAWKVRVRTSSVTHHFWVDAAPPHRIVRARVEHLSYELTGFE